jgi:hypothetical protein
VSDKPIRVYIASPYSHDSEDVRHERFVAACRCADDLMAEGLIVFSPIAHSVAIENSRPDGRLDDGPTWLVQDFPWLDVCDALIVLTIDGWRTSKGVSAETDRWQQQRRGPCISWNPVNYTAKEAAGNLRDQLREYWDKGPETVLAEATRITSTERQRDYGHPRENFAAIAGMWNAYKGAKKDADFTPSDVASLMILVKVARQANAAKRDNAVDIAGYARTLAQCDGFEQ